MKLLTLQQIRAADAVVECGFSVSRAARILHMSQPSVSKTLKALEDDLLTPVFLRSGGRIVGLTDFGQDILGLVRGILHFSTAVLERAQQKKTESRDSLRVGTTHIYARYLLPGVIQLYLEKHPDASVHVHQGDSEQIAQWVAMGKVQVGISTFLGEAAGGVMAVPAIRVERCVITPLGHELMSSKKLTLTELVRHSLISYHDVLASVTQAERTFPDEGKSPKVVVETPDATVIKAYVGAGLGVAVVQRICIEAADEGALGVIDASHLFPPATAHLLLGRERDFRSNVHDFIEILAPEWTREALAEHSRINAPKGSDAKRRRARIPYVYGA